MERLNIEFKSDTKNNITLSANEIISAIKEKEYKEIKSWLDNNIQSIDDLEKLRKIVAVVLTFISNRI